MELCALASPALWAVLFRPLASGCSLGLAAPQLWLHLACPSARQAGQTACRIPGIGSACTWASDARHGHPLGMPLTCVTSTCSAAGWTHASCSTGPLVLPARAESSACDVQDESAPAALPPLLQPVQQPWLLAGLHMRLLLQHGGPDCHVFLEAAGHLLQPACSSSSRAASAEGWDGITFEPTELAQVQSCMPS